MVSRLKRRIQAVCVTISISLGGIRAIAIIEESFPTSWPDYTTFLPEPGRSILMALLPSRLDLVHVVLAFNQGAFSLNPRSTHFRHDTLKRYDGVVLLVFLRDADCTARASIMH